MLLFKNVVSRNMSMLTLLYVCIHYSFLKFKLYHVVRGLILFSKCYRLLAVHQSVWRRVKHFPCCRLDHTQSIDWLHACSRWCVLSYELGRWTSLQLRRVTILCQHGQHQQLQTMLTPSTNCENIRCTLCTSSATNQRTLLLCTEHFLLHFDAPAQDQAVWCDKVVWYDIDFSALALHTLDSTQYKHRTTPELTVDNVLISIRTSDFYESWCHNLAIDNDIWYFNDDNYLILYCNLIMFCEVYALWLCKITGSFLFFGMTVYFKHEYIQSFPDY